MRQVGGERMKADFVAGVPRAVCSREQCWIAPVLLAAVQPSPWLRPATCNSSQTRPTKNPDKATQSKGKQIQEKPSNKTLCGEGMVGVLVAQLVIVRLPVVVRFPAGPRESLKW